MKINKVEYKKQGTSIHIDVAICDCGGEMKEIGAAGCVHEDYYTYFYQCPNCKLVQLNDYRITRENEEELKKYGWKRV